MTSSKHDKDCAIEWACEERTIRNWRKKGAPLGNQEKMIAWLSARRAIPAGTKAILLQIRKERSAKIAANVPNPNSKFDVELGAPANLRRLQIAERDAAIEWETTKLTGDEYATSLAEKRWRAFSKAHLEFDLKVKEDRRNELEPRELLERLGRELAQALYHAMGGLEDIVPALVGLRDPLKVWSILQPIQQMIRNSIISWLGRPRSEDYAIPKWLLKAVAMDQNYGVFGSEEKLTAFWDIIRNEIVASAKEARAEIDKVEAENKAAPSTP